MTTKVRLTSQVKGTTPLSIPYVASDGAIGEVALGTSDQVLLGGAAAPEFAQLSHLVLGDIGTKSHADIDKAIGSGSSFPESPTAYQRHFRTDLGLECYYATGVPGWLTVDTFSISRNNSADSSDASDAGFIDYAILGIQYKPYITKIESAYIVNTYNNASDHYEINHSLIVSPTDYTGTTLLSHSTSSDAVNTRITRTDVINKQATGVFDYYLLVSNTDKTPGTFYYRTSTFYKLVIT